MFQRYKLMSKWEIETIMSEYCKRVFIHTLHRFHHPHLCRHRKTICVH